MLSTNLISRFGVQRTSGPQTGDTTHFFKISGANAPLVDPDKLQAMTLEEMAALPDSAVSAATTPEARRTAPQLPGFITQA